MLVHWLITISLFQVIKVQFATIAIDTAAFATPSYLGYRLREVDMDAPVVNEDIVHFKIGCLARFLIFKLHKGVLQRVACLSISYHFAAFNNAKATKYDLQIVVRGHGIEFANEEYVFWRRHISIWQIAHDFQYCGTCFGLALG